MSIVTYPLNGIEYDSEDAETYLCTRTSGVYSDDDCFDISITDDMEVTIGAGLAWINNADFKGKSVCNTNSVALELSLGAGTYPRTDRIVIQFDKENNISTLEILEGTPSESAEAPDIEQDETIYQLGLYEIYVPAGTTELSDEYITDTRLDEDVCGLMSDGVTGIPTAELYEQWQAWFEALQESTSEKEADYEAAFEEWFESVKDQLSEDAAGNLYNLIEELQETDTELQGTDTELQEAVTELQEAVAELQEISSSIYVEDGVLYITSYQSDSSDSTDEEPDDTETDTEEE